MVVQKFSECFWNTEFVSTVGFDILVKRIKDGRTASREVESFVKERAKIEDDYAKALHKLSKTSFGSTESGTLKDVLTALKNNVEKLSYLHQDLSQALVDQVGRMHSEREKLTTQCKVAEDSVKRLQGFKKDLYKQTLSSMQTYQKKSEAYEVSIQTYNTEKAQLQGTNNPKALRDLEKLEAKSMRCKDEKLKADDTYQGLVRQLEVTRTSWETEMVNMCETFQRVEHGRILFFRNELWAYTNFDSKTLYDQDQANEEARLVIEKCDADKDIQDFIQIYQTGTVRPAAVIYEEFDSRGPTRTAPRPAAIRPPAPPSSSTFFTADAVIEDDPDPTYSSIS